jgi:hypothetical protein
LVLLIFGVLDGSSIAFIFLKTNLWVSQPSLLQGFWVVQISFFQNKPGNAKQTLLMVPYKGAIGVFALLFVGLVAANGLSCQELGFRETLLCSSCKQLEQYISDKGKFVLI